MKEDSDYRLKPGVILDGRYLIIKVVGEGGFGITYAVRHIRSGVLFAVKEFFCREYMGRDPQAANEVFLLRQEDLEWFEKEKGKFLKEARTVADFSAEKGIVDIRDYFEDNGTAYIVMEYLEGITLKEYLREHGVFPAKDIFWMMLPLMEALGKVHEAGVIHRDISPDNIMVLPDQSLCLMDFGAARKYTAEGSCSVILKGGYTPGEQYDRFGKQGPWTDIYALSAVIYHCITGREPQDAYGRMLHDELKAPSELGITISRKMERILMKGLQPAREKRYQNIQDMAADIRRAFPGKRPQKQLRIGHAAAAGVLAGIAFVLLGLGVRYVQNHYVELKFRLKNVETVTVQLSPQEDTTLEDFQKDAEILKKRFEKLVGKDNLIWKEEEGRIEVAAPLEAYPNEDVDYTLKYYIASAWKMSLRYLDKRNEAFDKEDLEEITAELGQIQWMNSYWQEVMIGSDEYYYLRVKTGGELQDSLKTILDTEGESFAMMRDAGEESNGYFLSYATGDGETIYVVTGEEEPLLLEMSIFNISSEPLSGTYSYEYTWNEK